MPTPSGYGLTEEKNKDGTSNFEITCEDIPDGVSAFQKIRFETYIVATDFNGEKGVNRIVGVISWGFDPPGSTKPINGGETTFVPTNTFSSVAEQIVCGRYGGLRLSTGN